MIDTHCHLHDRKFDHDRDEVVARARRSGLTAMLTVGEDISDSRNAIRIAERYEIPVAVGVHPHQAKNAPSDVVAQLRALLDAPGVVAIGEIGLDYYYLHSPRDVQCSIMRTQLRLAREVNLPIVFHQRDAFDDFVAILRDELTSEMRAVVHCFTGTPQQAQTLVEQFGLFLGIGGVLTFPNAAPLREAVHSVGARALVLETDAPYLAPVPMRGKRNEPSFMGHTAAQLSEVLEIPLDELVAKTNANAAKLFKL